MIVILCSISTQYGNDDVLNGLVHFNLKANLHDADYMHAVYYRENRQMELVRKDGSRISLQPVKDKMHTVKYNCINRLLAMMNAGDHLMVCSLSDMADNADDARQLYFSFLSKGIHLSFFDASYLNTDMLKLNAQPSTDQKLMIQRIIRNYFESSDHLPSAIKEEPDLFNASNAEKKSHP